MLRDQAHAAGHSARHLRMRVVALVRAYRAAVEVYEHAAAAVDQGEGTVQALEHAGEAADQARNALFSALDELDQEEGRA